MQPPVQEDRVKGIEKLYGPRAKYGQSQDKDERDVTERFRKRAQEGESFWSDNFEASREDLNFLAGDQWPSQVKQEREFENRPCLVNNVLPTFVDQVLGDQRQNRPSIKISPVSMDYMSDAELEANESRIQSVSGRSDYSLAEVMSAIVRNIEYTSDAETSYDLAFQDSVESGLGWLRVLPSWRDDESFYQQIKIKHITNQFQVLIDPHAQEFDKSDMNWAIVYENMPKDQFKKLYPNATPEAPEGVQGMESWFAENTARVAEAIERVPCMKELALLSDGRIVDLGKIEQIIDELIEQGITIVRTRKVKSYKVIWRKISGANVLEGAQELCCSTIPLIPVFGKMTKTDQGIVYRSIIRHAKDAQRMANYWDSAATESVALAPKAPFVADATQIEGYEDDWRTANTKNHSVLMYNSMAPGDPGPRRAQGANVPAAEITMAMNATDKIKSTLGMYDASVGAAGNETSGKAIIARQRQGDRGSFAFIDNLSKSIRRVGQILVEMIPKVYDTEQVVRLKFEDDTEDFVRLNQRVYDEQSNEWITIHDLGAAKYDVVVSTGPSYATQRMEATDNILKFVQAFPQAAQIAGDIMMANMDFPFADVLAKRLRKAVPPNLLTAEEQEELQDAQPEPEGPTPEQQVQMAELEAKLAQAQADIAKAQTDVELANLKVQEAEAKLAESQVDLREQIQETVAQALAELVP